MNELRDFIMAHAVRGTCHCGMCIDAPDKDQQPNGHTVDLVFFEVAAIGEPDPEVLKQLIVQSERGDFANVDMFDGAEHGYMELGGWLGDQGLALMLMGLGSILGLWDLMTPKMLPGVPEDMIQKMAGAGMISAIPLGDKEKLLEVIDG